MLPKKIAASVLALAVSFAPLASSAQSLNVRTGSTSALAPSLGAAGGAPSIQLTDFSLANPLMSGANLAPALNPGLIAPSAAAVDVKIAAQPVAVAVANAPVSKPVIVRAIDAVKKKAAAMFSRKTPAPNAETSGQDGTRLFDGARKLIAATIIGATIVCAGGCAKDDVEPMEPGSGYVHLDDRPATAEAAVSELNNDLDASEAYAAHLGYNTWDREYHLGVPHRNDFNINGAHYAAPQQLPFDSAAARLSTMRVDQAVGSKLTYIDGAWVLIADDFPSDYWVSRWFTVGGPINATDAQDYLNRWLDASEAFDAKIAGDEYGWVRLTYPEDPLTLAYNQYWDMQSFDTFLEAMLFAEDNLDATQNRGAKIFFSPIDAAYFVLYPVETSSLSGRLGVSPTELDAAVAKNSRTVELSPDSPSRATGRTHRTVVDWKAVFAGLKKQPPTPR